MIEEPIIGCGAVNEVALLNRFGCVACVFCHSCLLFRSAVVRRCAVRATLIRGVGGRDVCLCGLAGATLVEQGIAHHRLHLPWV